MFIVVSGRPWTSLDASSNPTISANSSLFRINNLAWRGGFLRVIAGNAADFPNLHFAHDTEKSACFGHADSLNSHVGA
jgi:hypothetical protein